MKTYDSSDVSLSLRMHTKACASHKSTFTNWVEITTEEFPSWAVCERGGCYGDYWDTYYKDNEVVGKVIMPHGEKSYYKYIKDGVGEKYECDCERPYTKLEGFAQDGLITIKRED